MKRNFIGLLTNAREGAQALLFLVAAIVILFPQARTPGVVWLFRILFFIVGADTTWRRRAFLRMTPRQIYDTHRRPGAPRSSTLELVTFPFVVWALFLVGFAP